MSASAPVQAERRGAFWFVRLNRPEKRNALTEALLEGLVAACDEVEADANARGVVLWGAGGHFCAGADFGRFEQLGTEKGTLPFKESVKGSVPFDDPVVEHNRGFGRVLERLLALPVPTLAVVRGPAMGGGCGLAATLDRVIAAEDAVFAMPEVTLGVAPAQIAPFVARRIGATRARWLMLSGTRLDAAAALAAGLADLVTSNEGLAAAVAHELSALAVAEPTALRATKRLVTLATTVPLPDALDGAALEFARLLHGAPAREGIAAARARRRPAWHAEVPSLPEFA